ncbi:trichohyalin-like [Mercenaria mercenaria]|uniref:trichohyalin-like n=1 Tax=Mercenaria mercenaria TaxID=6596 RepID=UPI00234E7C79|nr:trichohyalin-like [Mercenaria mercenaria]
MKKKEERRQAQLQELQTNIATKKQHQKMREERQQGQFQKLKTVKDYLNPMSKMSLSSKEELQTNYRDTLEHKASENRDGDEKLLRRWMSQGTACQTGRHEDISSKPSSEEKESDKLESLRKRREELQKPEDVIHVPLFTKACIAQERTRKECKEFEEIKGSIHTTASYDGSTSSCVLS